MGRKEQTLRADTYLEAGLETGGRRGEPLGIKGMVSETEVFFITMLFFYSMKQCIKYRL